MRLTVDLINASLSYLNPLKERELDLRGHKIPLLENLAAPAVTTCDALDLTDNAIPALANFPLLPRLHTLLLARNRVAAIHPSLATTLPALTTLVLADNRLAALADLDALAALPRLTHLVLLGNPCAKLDAYREWVVARCPSVRFLDFQVVRAAERERAREVFGTREAPTQHAQKILASKRAATGARTFDVPEDGGVVAAGDGRMGRVKMTDRERKRVEKMLREATSLNEIVRLEKELNDGRIPGGVGGEDEEMAG